MFIFEILKAIFLGIIEGITEWLPISSTGHMILFNEFVKLDVSAEFMEMLLVVIQLGAICAVPILFFDKLNPFSKKKSETERKSTWSLWLKVLLGVIPAGVVGLIFDDFFNAHFYNFQVVTLALVIYGVAFIVIELINKTKRKDKFRVERVEDITYVDALKMGAFQVLSLIPGTSRSGSTIIGGMLTGVSRTASAEFSFFMAIPLMLGASALKISKFFIEGNSVSLTEGVLLLIGIVVSFFVSLVSIKFLMNFVKNHTFIFFGFYRIILGEIVLMCFTYFL